MKWISSEGGPLVLMNLKSLHLWKGIDSDDYGWACSENDYINVLDVSNSSALVLGDESNQTAIYISDRLGVIIVRW